jgi:peptide/nickel transport system substrate-binding protein
LLGIVGVDPDPNDQLNLWLSSSATHQWNPSQPKPETDWEAEIDDLMIAQASTSSIPRRKALLDRMQEVVSQQAPVIFLVHPHALVAVSPKLLNAKPTALRPRLLWNVDRLNLRHPGTGS